MPVEISMICFVMGNGLLTLGAFFIWQWVNHQQTIWSVLATILPVVGVVAVTCLLGQVELVGGIVWGTVAFNLGLMGGLGLCFKVRLERTKSLMVGLWLSFGWLACLLVQRSGVMGRLGGLSLLIIGLIATWQIGRQENWRFKNVSENHRNGFGWRPWIWLVTIGLIGVGAWLLVWKYAVVLAACGMPVSLGGTLVLAPICSCTALLGVRCRGRWQPEKVLCGLSWCNAILVTVGLGAVALTTGSVHLTQSTGAVTLPWVACLVVLSVVMTYLPEKTARWWGGLMVVTYVGLLLSWLL